MKQKFDVFGMSCAACSARITKVVSKVEGVQEVNVNLLRNSMEIDYDGQPQTIDDVIAAVKKAGYGAALQAQSNAGLGAGAAGLSGAAARGMANTAGAAAGTSGGAGASSAGALSGSAATQSNSVQSTLTPKVRLIISAIFTIPLFYLSMGHMFSWPLPEIFLGHEHMMITALTEFLLLIPVLCVNYAFFKNGFMALFKLSPNMDSLVALGAAASTIYGIAALFRMSYALGTSDFSAAHNAFMDLYFESAAVILTLITLGKTLEARAKGKTGAAIDALISLAPKTALLIGADGKETEIPAENLKVGDIFIVKSGMSIPADAVVVEGAAQVDESILTGEPMPVQKNIDDNLIGASIATQGWLKAKVSAVGSDSALAHIIALVDEASASKAPIERLADKISSVFVPVVIGIALVTFIIWIAATHDVAGALSHAVSVLVISCPCALGLATPTAIMVGMGRAARANILFKNAESLEQACATTIVAFDKTGTITKGNPQVTDVICALELGGDFNGEHPASNNKDLAGALDAQNVPESQSQDGINEQKKRLLKMAASIENYSEHPLAQAIISYTDNLQIKGDKLQDFETLPGQGVRALLNGKPLIAGNLSCLKEAGIDFKGIDFENIGGKNDGSKNASDKNIAGKNATALTGQSNELVGETETALKDQLDRLASEAKTALLFAYDNEFLGIIACADKVKADSKNGVAALHELGIKTVMMTGDSSKTAQIVASSVGVDKVYSQLKPAEKEQKVRELLWDGKIAFVGDGINDAPALARANTGIAIGAGTDIAIEAADVVLMSSKVADVAVALDLSRATMRNIKQNLFWALIYNVICIPVAAGCFAWANIALNPMIAAAAMSCSSLFVVCNALRLRRFKTRFDLKSNSTEAPDVEASNTGASNTEALSIEACGAAEPSRKQVINDTDKGEDEMAIKKTIEIRGMHCEHCVAHITEALETLEQVKSAKVSLKKENAVVKLADDSISDEALLDAIKSAGDFDARIA